MGIIEIGCEDLHWNQLAQVGVHWLQIEINSEHWQGVPKFNSSLVFV
jgi:hypothetical protein